MSDELIPPCTCGIGGHDHSADCAVEVEKRRVKVAERDDLQLTGNVWLDVEDADGGLAGDMADLAAIGRHYRNAYRWSLSEEGRKAYKDTKPEFLERIDRRVALAERLVDANAPTS